MRWFVSSYSAATSASRVGKWRYTVRSGTPAAAAALANVTSSPAAISSATPSSTRWRTTAALASWTLDMAVLLPEWQ